MLESIMHFLGVCPDSLTHPNFIALITALDNYFKFKR